MSEDKFLTLDVTGMLRYHAEGLQRVAKVIQKNAGYDDLMEHKLTSADRERFGGDVDIAEKRIRAVSLCAERLRTNNHKMILAEFRGVAYDGNTKNNLREFEFFQHLCSPFAEYRTVHNYSHLPRIAAGRLTSEQSSALEKIISDLEKFYHDSNIITASLVHQHVLYSRSYFSFFLSFSLTSAVKPTALVVANDHSPVRVALCMIAKGLSIPRIYLQHAEVTPNFPPLDFEYSVLRNKRSVEAYREAGPLLGRIYVIPRYKEPFAKEKLVRSRLIPTTVVIYPTSRFLVQPLTRLIRVLANNAAVKKIIIKEHPGATGGLGHLSSVADVDFSTAVPEEDHIAIVGNSSVAVELLHQGIPVYQNFDFDPVERDYYGLVKSAITAEISMADAAQVFWKPYDLSEQWLEAYSAWDASAAEEHIQDRMEFLRDMSNLNIPPTAHVKSPRRPMRGRFRAQAKGSLRRNLIKFVNAYPRLWSMAANKLLLGSKRITDRMAVNTDRVGRFLTANTDVQINAPIWRGSGQTPSRARIAQDDRELHRFLFDTLVKFEDPATWLLRNEKVGAFSASQMIAALELAFQERNPALNKVFEGIHDGVNGSAVACWAYLKKVEWGNLSVGQEELDSIANVIHRFDGDLIVKDLLEQALLVAIMRSGTCEQLDRMWQSASLLKLSNLSVTRKMQVLRKLRAERGRSTEADVLLEEIEQQASPFEMLKLENMEFLEGRRGMGWHHADAEQQFLAVAPPDLRREFSVQVKPTFDALRSQMHFMSVRSDKGEADRLLARISNALETKQPFSVIRLSDGEGYLFPGGTFFLDDDVSNRERHWWGTELSADLRANIVAQAREAITSADVVGIPTVYRFIRDHGEGSLSLSRSVQGRGLLEVLAGVSNLVSASTALTEDKVNVSLFSTPEQLLRLLPSAERVVIVSSILRHALPTVLQQHEALEAILLPTHHKTALNEKYNTGSRPLPFAYEGILEELEKTVKPGDLVLVAGGIIGKIFIGRSRAKGAVVLDLGHVVDDWISPNLASVR